MAPHHSSFSTSRNLAHGGPFSFVLLRCGPEQAGERSSLLDLYVKLLGHRHTIDPQFLHQEIPDCDSDCFAAGRVHSKLHELVERAHVYVTHLDGDQLQDQVLPVIERGEGVSYNPFERTAGFQRSGAISHAHESGTKCFIRGGFADSLRPDARKAK